MQDTDEPDVKIEYVFRKGVGWCPERLYLHNGKWLTVDEACDWLQEDMSKAVFEALRQPYRYMREYGPTIVYYPRALTYADGV